MNGRLWGAFHTPPNGDYNIMYMSPDFNTYFKPQMDAMVAQGWNLMAFFGSVFAGKSNLGLYLKEFQKIFDYGQTIGLYLYPYLSAAYSDWGSSVTDDEAAVVIGASAALASRSPMCIGACYTDEVFPNDATSPEVAMLVKANTSARAQCPSNFSMTATSNPCGNQASSNGNAMAYDAAFHSKQNLDVIITLCDHFCFNPQSPNVASDMTDLNTAFPSYPVIFGGASASTSDSSFATNATALSLLMSQKNVQAIAHFTMQNFASQAWGMWTGPTPTGPVAQRLNAVNGGISTATAIIRPNRGIYGSHMANQHRAVGY